MCSSRPPAKDQFSQLVSLNTTITFSGSSPCVRRRSISSASSFFLTFTLRPNLVYSDGAPLDAKSVKTNILRGRDDPKSLIAPQLAPVAQVHTPNATTVTLLHRTHAFEQL